MLEVLLVIVTAIGTLFVSAFFRKKDVLPGFVVPEEIAEMFAEIDEKAEEAQEEIKEALDGPTPEDDLANLGNRRQR